MGSRQYEELRKRGSLRKVESQSHCLWRNSTDLALQQEHGLHSSMKTALCLVPLTANFTESRISRPDLNKHSTCFGAEQTDCCQKTLCFCLVFDIAAHSLTTHTQPKLSSKTHRRASCPQDFPGGSSGYYPFLGLMSDSLPLFITCKADWCTHRDIPNLKEICFLKITAKPSRLKLASRSMK